MFDARLAKLSHQINNTLDGPTIYTHLVDAPTQRALDAVPIGFLVYSTEFRCQIGATLFTVPLGGRKPIQARWLDHHTGNVNDETPGVRQIKALQAQYADLVRERDQLVETMAAIVNECVTLNQVTKVWPTVLQHIPQEVLKRHNSPNTRAAPITPILDALMTDSVKTAMIKASMLAKQGD
jgi:hypothetical protein